MHPTFLHCFINNQQGLPGGVDRMLAQDEPLHMDTDKTRFFLDEVIDVHMQSVSRCYIPRV